MSEYLRSPSWEDFRKELGKQLALAREVYEEQCKVCGKPFIDPKKRQDCPDTRSAKDRRRNLHQASEIIGNS